MDYYVPRSGEKFKDYINGAQCFQNDELYVQAFEGAYKFAEIYISFASCYQNLYYGRLDERVCPSELIA